MEQRRRGSYPAVRKNEARGGWELLICQKLGIRATFWLDHLAFRRINIMICTEQVLSLAIKSGGAKNASARAIGPSTIN